MVETGDRNTADVVVVQRAGNRETQIKLNIIYTTSWTLSGLFQDTHRTSRDRRALNAPSSIQLMWFLSS